MKILLIEDDHDLSGALSRALRKRGFNVATCMDGAEALDVIRRDEFATILLDLSIPEVDGLRVLHWMRQNNNWTPVLLLTARGALGDRIAGLNAGADDYMSKPFDLDELEARVRALTRRAGSSSSEMACGALRCDMHSGIFFHGDRPLELSPREYSLLRALISKPGHGIAKEHLFAAVFESGASVQIEALEPVLHRLRRKLADAQVGVEIMTLRGVGYLLCETQSQAGNGVM